MGLLAGVLYPILWIWSVYWALRGAWDIAIWLEQRHLLKREAEEQRKKKR
jgi:hypothetical protein